MVATPLHGEVAPFRLISPPMRFPPQAAIGMFMGWGILIALGGLTYLLFMWDVGLVPYFAIMAALLSGGCVLTHWLLLRAADKYYCQG